MRHSRSLKILYIALGVTLLVTGISFYGLDLDYSATVGFQELIRPVLLLLGSPVSTLRDEFQLPAWLAGFIFCMALFTVHFFMLSYCRFLNTRSSRRLAVLFSVLTPMLIVDWNDLFRYPNPWSIAPWLLVPVLLIGMTGCITFSLPSTIMGAAPLFINYFFISLSFCTIQPPSDQLDGLAFLHPDVFTYIIFWQPYPLLIGLLFFAILPMSAHIFPKHRRFKELWHPTKLPRLALTVDGSGRGRPHFQEEEGGLM